MNTVAWIGEANRADKAATNILLFADFAPSTYNGGPILLKRLLQDYPPDRITVLTRVADLNASRVEDRLRCEHIGFPTLRTSRSLWVGKVKHLISWLLLAWFALRAAMIIKRRHVDVIMTVLHGRFCLAAAAAGWLTGTPYVVVVHDDFVSPTEGASSFSRRVVKPLTGIMLRRAAHIYVVSPAMQRLVRLEFKADSEVQWPSTEPHRLSSDSLNRNGESRVILFAGEVTYAVDDSLGLLADLIISGRLKSYGVPNTKLHVYTKVGTCKGHVLNQSHPDIIVDDWVPQAELPKVLSSADVLFLPYSFSEYSRHAVTTAFPSKTADYLAAGRPILVFGPSYSTLVGYAKEQAFAEVVTEFDMDALARGIQRIFSSRNYRDQLVSRSLEVFGRNHEVSRQRSNLRESLQRIAGNAS